MVFDNIFGLEELWTILPRATTIFIIQFLALLVGLVGNGIIILIFYQHRNMRTPTNYYVLSIALSDILVTVSCPGVMMVTDLAGSWPLGRVPCQLSQAAMEFSTCSCVLSLTVLSIERYYAVYKPIEKFNSGQRLSSLIIVTIWVVAGIFSAPKFLGSDIIKVEKGWNNGTSIFRCVLTAANNELMRYLSLFDFFFFYIIPLCVVCAMYVAIFKRLTNNTLTVHDQVRKKVARMVLILTAIFFLAFLPYNLLRLRIFFLGGTEGYWKSLTAYAYCFGCAHFVLNPIAMYVCCDSFRKHYNQYLSSWWCPFWREHTKTLQKSCDQTTLPSTDSNSLLSARLEEGRKKLVLELN